jgi:hypothetical protein
MIFRAAGGNRVDPEHFTVLALGALLLAGVGLIGCGAGNSADGTTASTVDSPVLTTIKSPQIPELRRGVRSGKGSTLHPTHWRVSEVLGAKEVRIFSAQGFCSGIEKAPRYKGYRISEKGQKMYITPYISRERISPGPSPRPSTAKPSRSLSGLEICRGVGGAQLGVIKLDRPLEDVMLYDATTTPPGLRWPRPTNG